MKVPFIFAALLGVVVLAVLISRPGTNKPLLDRESADPSTASEPKPEGAMPVLVELFTSEGCSSCPPADRVLALLAKSQPVSGAQVIALSEHVDYWNHLGWADPFSSSQFSDRQNQYASAFANDQIYTPQMIVDGQSEFVGSNLDQARGEIARAAARPKAVVEIRRTDDGGPGKSAKGSLSFSVNVSGLPQAKKGDRAEVLLALTQDGLASNVTRGENEGHRLTHTAVVRQLTVIGQINPEEGSFSGTPAVTLPQNLDLTAAHAVVFVQEHSTRHVVGAATIDLAGK